MSPNKTTYQDRQRAAKLACAGGVLLDPESSDEDRALAERDLGASRDGGAVDLDYLARSSPEMFAALVGVYKVARYKGLLVAPPRSVVAALASGAPMGVIDIEDPESDAPAD